MFRKLFATRDHKAYVKQGKRGRWRVFVTVGGKDMSIMLMSQINGYETRREALRVIDQLNEAWFETVPAPEEENE